MRTEGANRRAGFTLLELLVAMSLLSLITLVTFAALEFGSTTVTRDDVAAKEIDKISRAQVLLRRLINGAYPAWLKDGDQNREISFRGEVDRLEFTTHLPPSLDVGGFHRVVLTPDNATSPSELVMFWKVERNELDGSPRRESDRSVTLIRGVSALSFAYYGLKAGDQEAAWHTSWTRQASLPKLIRINGEIESSRRDLFWPPLHIRTLIDADAGCVYDPLTDNCRAR